MKSKNFVVTGATSFLGQKIIEYFLQDTEVKILALSRRPQHIDPVITNIKRVSGIDLLTPHGLEAVKNEVLEMFPDEIFHVINCAGSYWEHFPLTGVSLEDSFKVMRENLFTVFGAAYTLVPLMKDRGRGHFITFGCNSTRHHYPYMAPFTASKQGVATLMKSLCNEYSKWNLQFNCFLLSTVKTEREKQFKVNGDYENWLEPLEIAESVWALTQQENVLMNGTEIELMKYSEQYNWDGYFKRIQKP